MLSATKGLFPEAALGAEGVEVEARAEDVLFGPDFLAVKFYFGFSGFCPPRILRMSYIFLIVVVPSGVGGYGEVSFGGELGVCYVMGVWPFSLYVCSCLQYGVAVYFWHVGQRGRFFSLANVRVIEYRRLTPKVGVLLVVFSARRLGDFPGARVPRFGYLLCGSSLRSSIFRRLSNLL